MTAAPGPVLDRVSERRRAAALARHYRDVEHLSIAEIARRLGRAPAPPPPPPPPPRRVANPLPPPGPPPRPGRAPATIKAYLYDPSGEKAKAIKTRYRGTCRACGATTSPRNGKGDAYEYCRRCR